MRESAPPASGWRSSARSRRRRTSGARVLIVGAAVVCVLAARGGDRRRRRERRQGRARATRRARCVAPSGALGKDGLAIPVGAADAPSRRSRCGRTSAARPARHSRTPTATTIHELSGRGQLKVEYHLATIIDGNMGGTAPGTRPTPRPAPRTPASSPPYHDVLFLREGVVGPAGCSRYSTSWYAVNFPASWAHAAALAA